MLSPFSIVSNTVKKVDIIKSQISCVPNLWSFWMAGRQSPGATCLSNVRRGVSGHLFSLPTYIHCIWAPNLETGCHGLTVTCGCHTTWWPGHIAQHFSQHLRWVQIPCQIPKVHPKPSTLKVQTLDLGRTLHMTWSRLLGGTWVLIWFIWGLTESTQQKPLSKCNCLLRMVLPNAASQSIISSAVHPIGPSMSNTKMEAQRTRSWRGLLPSADTSEGKSRPLSNSSHTGGPCQPTRIIICTPWKIEIFQYWNTLLPDLNPLC